MKTRIAKNIALLIGVGIGSMSLASAAECDSVGSQVEKAITAAPEKVLVVVDEMISKNEACACEIVKAAIIASSADKALVREIVVTAVTAAQGMAATIAECAVAQAPEAASEIKAGLSEVFAGAYSAKGAKEVVEDVVEDFAPDPVVISGVYLVAPVGGGGGFFDEEAAERAERAQQAFDNAQRLIDILRREARRGSGAAGGGAVGPDPSPTNMISQPVFDNTGPN